jgi:hypothetical protein
MSDDDATADELPKEPVWEEHEIPPWGGRFYNRPFRPDKVSAVDPEEFRTVVLACVPQEWPKEYPEYWSTPLVDAFRHRLSARVGFMNDWKWTPVFCRFTALLRLLEAGQLGPGWPSEDDLLKNGQLFALHPALLHVASQLTLTPEGTGDFDPAEFRREAVRIAKAMGTALPPGVGGE